MHAPTLYGIPNCDTVKKARAWLTAAGVEHRLHDFKRVGLPEALLAGWIERLGWEALLNRQGTTWRRLDAATRAGVVDAASAAALLRAEPTLIKRPVALWPDGALTVGFDPVAWGERHARP